MPSHSGSRSPTTCTLHSPPTAVSLTSHQSHSQLVIHGSVETRWDPWLTHFLMQFVIKRWTSCLSSRSSMAPRYPIRLSVNFCDAISFKHSSWKWDFAHQTLQNSVRLKWALPAALLKIPIISEILFFSPGQSVPGSPACAYKAA